MRGEYVCCRSRSCSPRRGHGRRPVPAKIVSPSGGDPSDLLYGRNGLIPRSRPVGPGSAWTGGRRTRRSATSTTRLDRARGLQRVRRGAVRGLRPYFLVRTARPADDWIKRSPAIVLPPPAECCTVASRELRPSFREQLHEVRVKTSSAPAQVNRSASTVDVLNGAEGSRLDFAPGRSFDVRRPDDLSGFRNNSNDRFLCC